MTCITYKDTIRIVKPVVDGYGSEKIGEIANVKALFSQSTGWSHGANQSAIDSDAIAYIDPIDSFVTTNFYRLEGMMVIAELFGVPEEDAWYRIVDVNVGRDLLLCDKVDNIRIALKKTVGITGVS